MYNIIILYVLYSIAWLYEKQRLNNYINSILFITNLKCLINTKNVKYFYGEIVFYFFWNNCKQYYNEILIKTLCVFLYGIFYKIKIKLTIKSIESFQ